MAKKRNNREFWESGADNTISWRNYYDRLMELAITAFKWENLPDTVDERFLELTLFCYGQCLFFKEPNIEQYVVMKNILSGKPNIYNIPMMRRAYAVNGYSSDFDESNSVIIWNNYLHKGSRQSIVLFAKELAEIDRTIAVNVNAQKTPVLILCDEQQRLTMENFYMKYEGNQPFIFGDSSLNPNSIKALSTGAPYVADRLYELKTKKWNEALTYLGVSNVESKKERMLTAEVDRMQAGTIASRYPKLEARRAACEQINKMFGLDVWVNYREDTGVAGEEEGEDDEQVYD